METSVLAKISAGLPCAISMLAVAVAAPAGKSEEGNTPLVAQVIVARTTSGCFSEALHVTGYLVAREQAVVQLAQGDRVVDVLAQEGALVTLDQTLALVERQSLDPSKPGGGLKTDTMALKAPAANAAYVVAIAGDPVDAAVKAHPEGLTELEVICTTGQPCARVYQSTEFAGKR